MLYDSYHKKISKVVDVLRNIFKHIVLISIVGALLLAAIITFMATKGIVFDDKSISDDFEMTYGESFPLKSSAMFAKVAYEYSTDGVSWTKEMPTVPGQYKVRATAKTLFGANRYGNTYNFTFIARAVNVAVIDNEIVYGETPEIMSASLPFADELICERFIYADRLARTTNVTPDVSAIKIFNRDGTDVTSCYTITASTSPITVAQRHITVTVSDKQMIYNDTKLSFDGYELSAGTLASGDVLQAVFNKYLIDVGEVVNTPELCIVTSDGLDVSVHYAISTQIGVLKVDYRPLIIQTGSSEKVYDDVELVNTNYEIMGEYNIVDGHVMKCVSNTVIKNVDEVENILVFEITNSNGEDKTPNYSLFYERGTLKITPRPVSIFTESGTWMYDGEEHYTDIKIEGFCADHKVKASYPSIIDVGTIENKVEISSVQNNAGEEVLSNYDIQHVQMGTLTVTKRPITIAYESSLDNTYDGTEKSFENYEIISSLGLVESDKLNIVFKRFSQAGTYDNFAESLTITSTSRNIDVTVNYEITESVGQVVINKVKLTIRPDNGTKEYDGLAYIPTEYQITSGTLPAGHRLTVIYKYASADVGEYDTEIDIENTKIYYMGKDATANFELSSSNGRVVITQREIELGAESAQKPYDGTPLTATGYTLINGTLVEGHTVTFNSNGSQTEIGKSDNVIDENSVKITDASGNDVTKNYSITCQKGTLEVILRNLSVTANSASKVYDRTPLKGSTVTVDEISDTNDGLIEGHSLSFELSGSITNVGTTVNKIESLTVVDANNQDVSKYYTISKADGTLEITPIVITVTTGSASKIYDGTPLTCDEYTSDHDQKLLSGDKAVIEVKGTITDTGTVANVAILTITDSEDNDITKNGNYSVEYVYGNLTVSARVIRLVPLPEKTEKVYDGTPLTCELYKDISNKDNNEGLIDNHEITDILFSSLTDAGTSTISVEEISIYNGENEVSSNYDVQLEEVSYTVTKRKITVVSDSARKEYDGRPLTASGCSWSSESEHTLLDGHTVSATMSGSQTEEGKSNNTIVSGTVKVTDKYGANVTDNYEITQKEGTLEVYKTVVAKVISTKGGYIYLRMKAYGDYTGTSFGAAPYAPYSLRYNRVNYNYILWSSLTLNKNDYSTDTLIVSDATKYMLPYYMAIGGNYDYPSYNTEEYTSSDTSYTVPYYDYCYETEGTSGFDKYSPNNYSTYTNFVKNNYTDIDSDTKKALLELVSANGFSSMTTENKIIEVAKYLRTVGTYNTNYDVKLDSEEDVAVAFLTEYRQGASKHYAMAATMLYRALGIPARYVEGYIVNTTANEQTDVKDAHAWVEVFVERYGWMQIEVTTGFGGMIDNKIDISLKPADAEKKYDGTPLKATSVEVIDPTDEIQALLDSGYTISATFGGQQINVGQSSSSLDNVKIFDKNGNDVTYKFNINTINGILKVTPLPIDVYLYNISKNYDGTPLDYEGTKFYSIRDDAFKATGYTLELSVSFTNANVHSLTVSDINANISEYVTYKVMNGSNDISQNYCINIVTLSNTADPATYVVAQIKPRIIEITSASQTKYYREGSTLVNTTVTVTKGSLLLGHSLIAVPEGRLEKVGTVENTIDPSTVSIIDVNSNDVTQNYSVTIVNGTLTFLE